jgi:plasmid stabilization system protein ParE
LKVRYLRPARAELGEAVERYEQQRRGLGRDFRDEVYAAVERIKAFPLAWRALGANTRRCITRRFPYSVVYALEGDEIIVVAIAHHRREPTYWKDRIKQH